MAKNSKQTVFVGLSGGVDSSVTAALLKERGYHVVGVFMKNWTESLPGFDCPWQEDFQDAKRVAVQLGIDFKVYDFQKEYRHLVVDYMIDEYKAGRTPNPDIMCNQEVKFKLFLNAALKDGAHLIATGHYARITENKEQIAENSKDASKFPVHRSLFTAVDKNKDQSYFLYRVTEEALKKTLMPIGEFTKPEVRAMAKKYGLITAGKKDSQGICFVGKVGIKEFLQQFVKTKPGKIIDQNKKVIGQHDGAIYYTIGQRKGLGIGGRRLPAGRQGLPYYVIGKDMSKNEVYVTTDLDDKNLWQKNLKLTDLHWINHPPAQGPSSSIRDLTVRTRYRAPLVAVKSLSFQDPTLEIELKEEVRAITPGQSAVIYDGDRVVGGGIVI